MAKVSLSSLLDSLTGKLSGSVFQNSVGGLQLRSRVSPRNPRSQRQQNNRGNWSQTASGWNALSPSQILSWNSGAPVGVPGKSFFQAVNQQLFTANAAPLLEYTGGSALADPLTQINYVNPDGLGLAFPGLPEFLPADTYLNISATRSFSPGTSFITDSAYLLIKSWPPGYPAAESAEYRDAYQAVFAKPTVGSVIGVRAYQINAATGQISIYSQAQAYVDVE